MPPALTLDSSEDDGFDSHYDDFEIVVPKKNKRKGKVNLMMIVDASAQKDVTVASSLKVRILFYPSLILGQSISPFDDDSGFGSQCFM